MNKVRLGIVGCGAVTQQYHLPASRFVPSVEIAALTDKNEELAKRLSREFKIPYFCSDYHEAFDLVDGVLIALPHYLHASATIDFLRRGIPVLCEKPMATSSDEAKEMLGTSQKYNTPLAAGFMRRFYKSSRQVRRIVSAKILGKIRYIDFEEGSVYRWQTASGFYFDKKAAGGGVLMDTGAHTLDLLLWWFSTNISHIEYKDDNLGGIEANCALRLVMNRENSSFPGRIELSRERNLRNSYKIFGTKGWLEYFPGDWEHIKLHLTENNDGSFERSKSKESHRYTTNVLTYFAAQLHDFGRVVAGEKDPYVDGNLAYWAIRLMETCYRNRKDLEMPWITNGLDFQQARFGR